MRDGSVILIAEDNLLIAMVMEDDLREAGYETAGPAATIKAALALADAHEISLALVDIDLAHGDSGLELAADLTSKHAIPCLFATGQALDAISNAGTALGVLHKPFDGDQLTTAVEFALKIASGTAEAGALDDERTPVTWFGRGKGGADPKTVSNG